MSISLKTTLRLDGDLLRQTKKYAIEQDKSLKEVIEQSLKLFLKQKRVLSKPSARNFYRWAEILSKKKYFSHLKEGDVVRLIRESRGY